MNRNLRRGRTPRLNESTTRFNANKASRRPNGIHEVAYTPKPRKEEKSTRNRCCYVIPDQRDFGQFFANEVDIPLKENKRVLKQPVHVHTGLDAQSIYARINTGMVTQPINTGMVTQPVHTGLDAQSIYARINTGMDTQPINTGMVTQPINTGMVTQPIHTGMVTQTIHTGISAQPIHTGMVTQPITTGKSSQASDQYQKLLAEQYGYDPLIPDTISQLKELKRVLCGNSPKVENGSQYVKQKSARYIKTSDGSHWENVDNIEDIDKLITQDGKDSQIIYQRPPRHMCISEVPRVKIIAEKYSKYKRNNLEVRRLDEKLVCVEYDVFNKSSNGDLLVPVQKMRTFFSIKPAFDVDGRDEKGASLPRIPSSVKHIFDMEDEDLNKLTEKEIEIIDDKIEENKSYLEDLRRILKRKQAINAKKNKTSLDLQSLYEMAKKDQSPLDCDFSDANLLSKAELQEVKDLILQRCTSSVHGIRRRRIKRKEKESNMETDVVSESIVAELLRDDPNTK